MGRRDGLSLKYFKRRATLRQDGLGKARAGGSALSSATPQGLGALGEESSPILSTARRLFAFCAL